MPNFFAGVTGKNTATLFDIRLDSDVIVLRGGESEAASQLLRGVVVLCLRDTEKVQDVHLKMSGQSRVGWNDQKLTASGISNNRVSQTSEIFSHKWPPFVGGDGSGSSSRGVTLGGSNYEWPFELVVPGDLAESVEGLSDSHVRYRLKATVARGKWAYDLHCTKAIRVIRTFDPAALELAHAMAVENVWPNKVEYSLVVPQKAIIFGTSIGIDMRFTSLLKGLRIGRIKCQLVETQDFTLTAAGLPDRYYKNSREIGNWTFQINEEEHYREMLNDEGQDGFLLHEVLPLPKSLKRCLQDCETNGIKIRHKVKFNVALHNPDGHTSELRATLPITIFISPNMPLDESGNLCDQTPHGEHSPGLDAHAPPLYGEHILDQLYADVDPSGYLTPAPQSGMNTPFHAHSRSRSGSNENLVAIGSLDGITSTAIRPDALSSRLQSLDVNPGAPLSRNNSLLRGHRATRSGVTTPLAEEGALHHALASTSSVAALGAGSGIGLAPRVASGYFAVAPAPANTSRRTSEEEQIQQYGMRSGLTSGQHTPEHDDYPDLSKVPSYSTALRAPVRPLGYGAGPTETLPNYETATSAPPSPIRSFAIPAAPAMAHLGERESNGTEGPATVNGIGSGNGNGIGVDGERVSMFPGGLSPILAHAAHDDAGRRVQLMQARGRAH